MNLLAMQGPEFDPWVGQIPWGREWRPTPVFLPGEAHGQRSLAGYRPWSHEELDMTEQLSMIQYYVESPASVYLLWEGISQEVAHLLKIRNVFQALTSKEFLYSHSWNLNCVYLNISAMLCPLTLPILDSWSLFPPFYLSIHLFIPQAINEHLWRSYLENYLYLEYKLITPIVKSCGGGIV